MFQVENSNQVQFYIMSNFYSDPNRYEKVKIMVEECGGLDNLETLQRHESENIYNLAYQVRDSAISYTFLNYLFLDCRRAL